MKAVIYARYSSDNQTEASIEGQLRECMEYAERTRIDVIGNYIDRALTAKTDNRPEFQRMIKDSYKHAFDIIIVWKLDRFSRNRYDSAYYKALLKKNGVKVVSAKETIAEGSEGILLEAVLEGYAEFYSAELSEKVVRGMTENVLKGRNNGGQVTFGYEIDDDMYFHPHPTTAPIVEEIFTMYDDGKTIKQIVDYLEEKNIKTIRGGKMTINIVQRMLSNRRYIGEYKFRDTVIPDGIPALVNKDLFERVQQKLAKNKKAPARRKAEDDYLLTLKLFCGKCGAHMFGESGMGTSKVYRYYKCAKTKKVHLCDKKPVRKEWMEDLAVKKALEILNNEDLISVLVERIYALQGEENPRIPRLKEQLADIEKRIGNIMSAIEQGIITDTTKDRLSQLETQKKEIEITLLQERIKKPFLTKEQIQFGIERYKKLDLSTLEGKRRLIEAFINAIYVYDDKIVFTFNYKDGTQTVSMSELTTMTATGDNSDMNCIGAPTKKHTANAACFFHFRPMCGDIFLPYRHALARLPSTKARRRGQYARDLYVSPQSAIASITGRSERPTSVSEYSTRGGTSANTSREIMPSLSKARRFSDSTFCDMPDTLFLSSPNRRAPSSKSRIISSFHLFPISRTVVATGHSGNSAFVSISASHVFVVRSHHIMIKALRQAYSI